jgi:hypothetical protein
MSSGVKRGRDDLRSSVRVMGLKKTAAPPRLRLIRFLPGRGRNWNVALSRVDAVFADQIRKLGQ